MQYKCRACPQGVIASEAQHEARDGLCALCHQQSLVGWLPISAAPSDVLDLARAIDDTPNGARLRLGWRDPLKDHGPVAFWLSNKAVSHWHQMPSLGATLQAEAASEKENERG